MKEFFEKLLNYNHYSNQQICDLFKANEEALTDKATLLFSHTLNAHDIWNCRIKGETPVFGVWDIHPLEKLKMLNENNYKGSLLILGKYNLEETIHYVNSMGKAYDKQVQDILFHIINHSTYHRAQIATDLKNAGIAPVATDYIFYPGL